MVHCDVDQAGGLETAEHFDLAISARWQSGCVQCSAKEGAAPVIDK